MKEMGIKMNRIVQLIVLNCMLALTGVMSTFAMVDQKQGLIHFEMANYFLQGGDYKNAIKYYRKSQSKLGIEDLEIVHCRNMANAYMMVEDLDNTRSVLESCIKTSDYKKIEQSAALREVYKVYAQLVADRINPDILDRKREMVKQRMQKMKQAAATRKGPKLGFK